MIPHPDDIRKEKRAVKVQSDSNKVKGRNKVHGKTKVRRRIAAASRGANR